jgi:hypothetical protein
MILFQILRASSAALRSEEFETFLDQWPNNSERKIGWRGRVVEI